MLIYGIKDKPKTAKEWLLYPFQQVIAVLTATLLISSVCGTPLDSGLAAAGIGTLVYLVLSGFKIPMFVSNAGGTVSAVISTLALSGGNTFAVMVGGFITALLYFFVGLGVKKSGTAWLNKLLPDYLVGSIIMVIGINLSKYSVTYLQVGGAYSLIGVLIGFITMFITALVARYGKGFIKTIPFLIALGVGYVICLILEPFGIHLLNLKAFENIKLFSMPNFAFLTASPSSFDWAWLPQIIVMWVATSAALMLEHIGDHKSLSAVIGTDVTINPGLHRSLWADGTASFIGTIIGQQPNTSYGESISCTAVSRVGSCYVIAVAAIMMVLASFFQPLMAFFNSISSVLFGGISLIAYGMIAFSGLNLLIKSKISYEDTSKVMVICAVLSVGIGGVSLVLGPIVFEGVSLAMIVGVVMNAILNCRHQN